MHQLPWSEDPLHNMVQNRFRSIPRLRIRPPTNMPSKLAVWVVAESSPWNDDHAHRP